MCGLVLFGLLSIRVLLIVQFLIWPYFCVRVLWEIYGELYSKQESSLTTGLKASTKWTLLLMMTWMLRNQGPSCALWKGHENGVPANSQPLTRDFPWSLRYGSCRDLFYWHPEFYWIKYSPSCKLLENSMSVTANFSLEWIYINTIMAKWGAKFSEARIGSDFSGSTLDTALMWMDTALHTPMNHEDHPHLEHQDMSTHSRWIIT